MLSRHSSHGKRMPEKLVADRGFLKSLGRIKILLVGNKEQLDIPSNCDSMLPILTMMISNL